MTAEKKQIPDEIWTIHGGYAYSDDGTCFYTGTQINPDDVSYTRTDQYIAVCAERDKLRVLCEGMAGKLRLIGEGLPENPCGDPWAFYMDLVKLAREALTDYEKHKGVGGYV